MMGYFSDEEKPTRHSNPEDVSTLVILAQWTRAFVFPSPSIRKT
jgi:hypothetical protein